MLSRRARLCDDPLVPTHVALLRGINLAGRNRVAMADLRELVTSLGHTDVTTYIQSGNVLFTTAETDEAKLAEEIQRAIAERLDVRPPVVVVSRDELARVVAKNRYAHEADGRKVHGVCRDAPGGRAVVDAVAVAQRRAAEQGGRDEATVQGRVVYLHTPDGLGRSQLAATLLGDARALGPSATARNWSTVTKLLALCDG